MDNWYEDEGGGDCYISIYPHPYDPSVGEYQYAYNHDDLAGFSKRALEKYNQDMHKRYRFVELVEGFLYSSHEGDSVTAYFKACQQPGVMNVTFVATTDCPLGTLSLIPKHDPEIITVFPWTSESRVADPLVFPYFSNTSTYGSESGSRSRSPPGTTTVGGTG